MPNILDFFSNARHRAAYDELMNYPISSMIAELQDEFPLLNFHGFTEPSLENDYPATKLTVSNSIRTESVFVVFNSPYAKYGIGRKNPNGDLNSLQTADTCEEAGDAIKAQFRQMLANW